MKLKCKTCAEKVLKTLVLVQNILIRFVSERIIKTKTYRLKTTPKVLDMTPMVFFQPLMNWRRRAPRGVAARTSNSAYELILPAFTAQTKTPHHCSKTLAIKTIWITPRALHQEEVHVRY